MAGINYVLILFIHFINIYLYDWSIHTQNKNTFIH